MKTAPLTERPGAVGSGTVTDFAAEARLGGANKAIDIAARLSKRIGVIIASEPFAQLPIQR
jgi:hypothetical protein